MCHLDNNSVLTYSSLVNPEIININVLIRKTGRVTKEYQFLTPPIGKGSTSEIRKAINRKTGILRTVKIVQQSSGREDDRVQNELKMLERLVLNCSINRIIHASLKSMNTTLMNDFITLYLNIMQVVNCSIGLNNRDNSQKNKLLR